MNVPVLVVENLLLYMSKYLSDEEFEASTNALANNFGNVGVLTQILLRQGREESSFGLWQCQVRSSPLLPTTIAFALLNSGTNVVLAKHDFDLARILPEAEEIEAIFNKLIKKANEHPEAYRP